MKFHYEYKDSKNQRQHGMVAASSRDAVYRILKQQGIRPYKVELEASLLNRILSIGKRGFAIVVLCVVLTVLLTMLLRKPSNVSVWSDTTRRQIIGDTLIIEKGLMSGWADVFDLEGDRFLASFAVPGVKSGVLSTTVANVEESLRRCVGVREDDGIEVQQIKAIVLGLKNEANKFIQDGGSVKEYCERLVERQEREIGYYDQVKSELDAAVKRGASRPEVIGLWEKRNEELRQMGIRLVPLPQQKGE